MNEIYNDVDSFARFYCQSDKHVIDLDKGTLEVDIHDGDCEYAPVDYDQVSRGRTTINVFKIADILAWKESEGDEEGFL